MAHCYVTSQESKCKKHPNLRSELVPFNGSFPFKNWPDHPHRGSFTPKKAPVMWHTISKCQVIIGWGCQTTQEKWQIRWSNRLSIPHSFSRLLHFLSCALIGVALCTRGRTGEAGQAGILSSQHHSKSWEETARDYFKTIISLLDACKIWSSCCCNKEISSSKMEKES